MTTRQLIGTVLCALCLGACEGRSRQPEPADTEPRATRSEPHIAELDLQAGVPEQGATGLFVSHEESSFAHLVELIRTLQADRGNVRGLFVRLGTAHVGFAQAHELGRLLGALRQDLPVVCHADSADNGSMLLMAMGCSEIWVSPAGSVDTVGLAAQLLFGRTLLEKLSIRADFIQEGKAKGAIEPFTQDSSSPEARESLRSTLESLRDAWIQAIATGRNRDAAKLALEDGPHTAQAARTLGLIDEIGYDREARSAALEHAAVNNLVVAFGGASPEEPTIADLLRLLSGTSPVASERVVVLRATGAITMTGGSLLGGGEGIAARPLLRTLQELSEDENVRAVVLRIDSPGGSALASDLLWKGLMRLRERKPLVVSVGAMAASGGCYLAAAADEVWAEPSSIVGSIGVLGGKLSFGNSLAELGVYVETVKPTEDTGNRALLNSPFEAWDEATRAKIEQSIHQMYELFVQRVAEGRGKPVEEVRRAADGQIFGGTEALELGLVDELGGLSDAIQSALRRADLPEDAPIEILAPRSGVLDLLGMDEAKSERRILDQLERRAAHSALTALGGPLAPFRMEIAAYADSVTPLLRGQRVLAALPFALALR